MSTQPTTHHSEDDVQDLAMALAWEHACATRQADRDKEIPLEHWMQLDAWEQVGFTAAANAAIKNLRPAGVLGDVAAERRRQIEVEGFTAEHDDAYPAGQLAAAGLCFAEVAVERLRHGITILEDVPPALWPWSSRWWKPKGNRRDLIRAIALLVAEVERQDRASPSTPTNEATHG